MAEGKINSDLKLVIPIRWSEKVVEKDGKDVSVTEPVAWVYHTGITREVFEANYRPISIAHTELFAKGAAFAYDAPIIGTLTFRDAARAEAAEAGLDIADPEKPFLAELRRLTMVLAPSEHGYEALPVDIALSKGVIDSDDWKEAESSIVFFTCGWWMTPRDRRAKRIPQLVLAVRGSTTSLSPTEYVASLSTSTPAETTAPIEPSSVPS